MKKLFRIKKNQVIGGVLSGLGDYFDIDPVILRIIVVIAVFVIHSLGGVLLLGYITAMVILPYQPTELSENSEGGAKEITTEPKSMNHQTILAWALIIIGCISLFFVLIPASFLQFTNQFFWPTLLVLVGVLILISSIQKK